MVSIKEDNDGTFVRSVGPRRRSQKILLRRASVHAGRSDNLTSLKALCGLSIWCYCGPDGAFTLLIKCTIEPTDTYYVLDAHSARVVLTSAKTFPIPGWRWKRLVYQALDRSACG